MYVYINFDLVKGFIYTISFDVQRYAKYVVVCPTQCHYSLC